MKKLKDNKKLKPRFTFRCNDEQYALINKEAEKAGLSLNKYLLELINENAK